MAIPVILPKQGNSVESCIIKTWLKKVGDAVKEGDGLCEVETDKATVEVPAPAAGTLLAIFRQVGEDVPVQTNIGALGNPGEAFAEFAPGGAAASAGSAGLQAGIGETPAAPVATQSVAAPAASAPAPAAADHPGASPKAKAIAAERGVQITSLAGTGPAGLVIERDVRNAPAMTPAAAAAGGATPATGTGIGGRITVADRAAPAAAPAIPAPIIAAAPGTITDIPVKGIRKIVAERMRASLSGSAQLTLTATAKAANLQAWRAKAKAKGDALGLPGITVNDLILFAVARTLPKHPALNAHWLGDKIRQFGDIHLGMAVDTERGLMVPVLKDAGRKSLAQIATDAKTLAKGAQAGKLGPELLSGSTFSITNVGALGIESFTPVLNTPEVAILGVGAITLRPYQGETAVEFIPSVHLSLTIDHQALDGAPAARFLQALVQAIESIDLLLAV